MTASQTLEKIFRTNFPEENNCPFYLKMGNCRFGDQCRRLHNRPTKSKTLLFKSLYVSPESETTSDGGAALTKDQLQEHFEDFYEDFFTEIAKYGTVIEMDCCENRGKHLFGNVYVRYSDEDAAREAVQALQGRFFFGRALMVEFSPVNHLREACCRQHEIGQCSRGGFCGFMHLKKISSGVALGLFSQNKGGE